MTQPFGATAWAAGPVCIDELVTVLAQYPTDVRWNGFLCPFMDPVAVNEVMAALQRDPGDQPSPTHEWRDDGVLIVTEYDGDDAYPEELRPDEDGLYSLGAYSWVWSEDPESTEKEVLNQCPLETSYGTGRPTTYCTRTRYPGREWCAEHLFEWGRITEAEYEAAPANSKDTP